MDGYYVPVLDSRDQPALLLEPSPPAASGSRLDRHQFAETDMPGSVDDCHPTPADFLHEFVSLLPEEFGVRARMGATVFRGGARRCLATATLLRKDGMNKFGVSRKSRHVIFRCGLLALSATELALDL